MATSLIPTPFLRLDVAKLVANIAAAQSQADAAGYLLRPHAKTHKCFEIARRQCDQGAVGLTVATVSEAEVFAKGGFHDLFIAYPLWVDQPKAARLQALLDQGVKLRLGVDSQRSLEAIHDHDLRVELMIEIDSGHHRSGCQPTSAGQVAQRATQLGLTVVGIFTFPGHSYSPGCGEQAARDESVALRQAAAALRAVGVEPAVISGGSTPSFTASDAALLSEARPGVYVTGDAQQWELGSYHASQIALTCEATVVSVSSEQIVVDAGSKVLAADRPVWASGFGRVLAEPEARIIALSEHHATITWPGLAPELGTRVQIVPNHACNAINLVDELIAVYPDAHLEHWPVAARGCNT